MRNSFNIKNNSKNSFNKNSNKKNKKEILKQILILRQKDFSDSKFDIKQFLDNEKTKYIFNTLDKKEKNLTNKSTYNLTKQNSFGSKSFGKMLAKSSDKKQKLNLPSLSMNISKNSISNIYEPKTKYFGSNTNYNLNVLKTINPKINTSYNRSSNKNNDNFFNVRTTIKSIKLKEKNFDFQSYLKETKNITEKKNALIALDYTNIYFHYTKKRNFSK